MNKAIHFLLVIMSSLCPCGSVTISCWHMLRCGHLILNIFLVCQFAVFSRKNNILIFYAFLFFPLSFSQKKRERLDGENIYIRHSNLMLEVCMNLKLISVACNLHSSLIPFLVSGLRLVLHAIA